MSRAARHRLRALAVTAILAAIMAACSRERSPEGVVYTGESYTLYADSLVEASGVVAKATSSLHITSYSPHSPETREWRAASPTDRFPRVTTGMKLPDALYNMAVATVDSATTLSPTAILLSMAWLDPERSMSALRSRVRNGRITDESGSWPVDISRVEWIAAAAEVFKATGDTDWARELLDIAQRTLRDDSHVNYRPELELYCGSMVAVDRAESYYPEWMKPVDMYSSLSLTANALYARAYASIAEVAQALGLEDERYADIAGVLSRSVNMRFWTPDKGWYSQYLYGAMPAQSPATDNLGQALCVLWGIATPDMAHRLFEKTPVTDYGTPAVWPSPFASAGPYCDCINAVTEAFRALAAARAVHEQALMLSIASQMRGAAMACAEAPFINAFTGTTLADIKVGATERIEAASGRLATYFRILAGMGFLTDGIEFHPVVPTTFKEEKFITGFRYRHAELSVVVHGTGNRIARFTIDGRATARPFFPGDLAGRHSIEITMANNAFETSTLKRVAERVELPPIPQAHLTPSGTIEINDTPAAKTAYNVFIDGIFDEEIAAPLYSYPDRGSTAFIAISTHGRDGRDGYTCRPMLHLPLDNLLKVNAADFAVPGTRLIPDKVMAARFVELSDTLNSHLPFEVEARGGNYLIDVHYANGSGSPLLQDYCGIRTLLVNGDRAGVLIMPTIATGNWSRTGFSNVVTARLENGTNTIAIDYVVPFNINSAGSPNTVIIDYIRIMRI